MAASVNNYIFSVNSVDCWRQSSSKLWLCIEHLGTMSVTTAAEYRSGQYRQSPATFTERRKDHKCLNDKHRSLKGSAASENSVSGEGSHIQTWHWVKHFGKRVAFPCKSTRKLLESLMQVLVQRVMISLPCQHGHDSGDCSELSVGDLCPLLEMLVGWAGGRERGVDGLRNVFGRWNDAAWWFKWGKWKEEGWLLILDGWMVMSLSKSRTQGKSKFRSEEYFFLAILEFPWQLLRGVHCLKRNTGLQHCKVFSSELPHFFLLPLS